MAISCMRRALTAARAGDEKAAGVVQVRVDSYGQYLVWACLGRYLVMCGMGACAAKLASHSGRDSWVGTLAWFNEVWDSVLRHFFGKEMFSWQCFDVSSPSSYLTVICGGTTSSTGITWHTRGRSWHRRAGWAARGPGTAC